MYRLFALAIIFPSVAFGAPGNLNLSSGTQNQIQLNEVDTKKDFQRLSIVSPTLKELWTLSAQYSFEQNDISTRNLTGPNGTETPLSAIDDGKREIVTAATELNLRTFLFSLSTSQDTKSSVFARKSYSLLLQTSPYSGATRIFLSGEFAQQDQPESYFTDPETLLSRRRLSKITTQTLNLGLEQIVTESYRTLVTLNESRLLNYRPRQYKISWANAYALNSRHTLRGDLGTAFEDRTESLKDDRGYFNSHWLEAQWTFESSLETYWGLGWSSVFERENDPRRSVNTEVGTDSIGAFVEKNFDPLTASFKFSHSQTSLKDTALSLQGDLKWEF